MFYEELFRQLNKKRIDYVVVGGVALVMHGVVRFTADLDLMLHLEEKNLRRFVDLMGEMGYKPRIPVRAEGLVDVDQREQWVEEKNMLVFSFYHPREAVSLVDVFIQELLPFEEIKAHAVEMKLGNLSVPVISIEDMIIMKKQSDRPQDAEDIKALKRLQPGGKKR